MCPARPSILSRSSSGMGGAEARRWRLLAEEALEETESMVLTPDSMA